MFVRTYTARIFRTINLLAQAQPAASGAGVARQPVQGHASRYSRADGDTTRGPPKNERRAKTSFPKKKAVPRFGRVWYHYDSTERAVAPTQDRSFIFRPGASGEETRASCLFPALSGRSTRKISAQ